MEIPKTLIELLNESHVQYEILHHPEAFTAQTIAEAEHIKGQHHAKVVMVRCGDRHLMVVLPSNRWIDFEKLEKISGQTVYLEKEPEFNNLFPDCALGTMPPFGNLYGLVTYVDESLSKQDYIVFEAGTHTEAIKLSYADYERIARPNVEDLAIGPRAIRETGERG